MQLWHPPRVIFNLIRLSSHAADHRIGGILITTHSAYGKMCIYRAQITWNPAQWDPAQIKQAGSTTAFPAPSFRIVHCKVETPCDILGASPSTGGTHVDMLSLSNPLYSLTRLDIVSVSVDNPTSSTSPWIIGVFSNSPHSAPEQQQKQLPSSILVRWQLETGSQTLHPKFDEVASKKANVQNKVRIHLMYLMPMSLY